MKPIHYARKKRQLHYLARRLNDLLLHRKQVSKSQIEKLVSKIQKLVAELIHVISRSDMKRILGAAALYLGISFPYQASAQEFAAPLANPFGLTPTYYWAFPAFADLDGDGDIDLLVGEYYGALQYFENTGSASNPEFAEPQINPFGLDSAYYFTVPSIADLDGDGDLDVLVGQGDGMIYFENTGNKANPQFAEPQINPFGLESLYYYIVMPEFVDLDADGDFDLMVGVDYDIILYYENTGTASNPQFATPQENPFGLDSSGDYFGMPTFADLDEDGDLDMLVGWGYYEGYMLYYENIGSASNPEFAEFQLNPFGLDFTYYLALPAFADLDDDGDMDLLVGEYYGNMQYFENTGSSSAKNLFQNFDLQTFPNPVSDILTIHTESKIVRVEIFNALGQSICAFENDNNTIQLDNLSPGMYLVKFTTSEGSFTTRKIQKQ